MQVQDFGSRVISTARTRCARLIVPVASVILVAVVAACAPAKPSGAEYLGKWHLEATCWTGSRAECVFEISKNGESLVMTKVVDTCAQSCAGHEGIYTLTPEGNLTGGGPFAATMSFDKTKGQILFSLGGGLQYLSKTQ